MNDCPHRTDVEAASLAELRSSLVALPIVTGDPFAAQRTRRRLLASFAAPRWSRMRVGASVLAAAAIAAVIAVAAWPRASDPQPGAVVTIAPTTSARWSRHDEPGSTLVRLDEGSLDLHVAHGDAAQHRLVVSLPDGELDDLGTTFRVVVENRRTSAVVVTEGAVVVRLVGRAPVFLVAGEAWRAPSPPPAKPPIALRAPARPPPPPPLPPPHPPAPPRPAGEFRDAARLFDRGELPAAISALRAFLTHHRDDARAEDATYLLILALGRHGEPAAARAEARAYLARYPNGFRRTEVERLATDRRP